MGSLKKLSESLGLFKETKERMKQRMKVVRFECDEVEESYKGFHEFSSERVGEMDSREKYLRSREDEIAAKEKDLDLRVEKIDEMNRNLELRQQVIDLIEKRKKDEIDAKEKSLEMRVKKVDEMERNMERRRQEMDSEEKRKLSELDSRRRILVEKEKELDTRKKKLISEKKMLEERSFLADSKEKLLESREMELNSATKKMNRRVNELDKRDKALMTFAKKLEAKEGVLDIKAELLSVNNFVVKFFRESNNNAVSLTESADVSAFGRKGVSPRDEHRNLEEDRIKRAKEPSCIHEKSTKQITDDDPQNPGTTKRSRVHVPEDVVDLDPEPESEIIGNLASNSVSDPSFSGSEKGKLTRKYNVGETWTCFDVRDHMPRTYARITDVVTESGEIRLHVAWLKPSPQYEGEKEWVAAGLPVTCGKFKLGKTSVESPSKFFQATFCAVDIIVPCEGETWAIYKDWKIMEWVYDTQKYEHCKYEMVEILPYPLEESSFSGVSVAYLDRMAESGKFKRRSKNKEDSFVIEPKCLYRFSHKVHSIKILCIGENDILDTIFELDLNCLPLQLH